MNRPPMDDQNKNLLLASVLSFALIMAWPFLFPQPAPDQPAPLPEQTVAEDGTVATTRRCNTGH